MKFQIRWRWILLGLVGGLLLFAGIQQGVAKAQGSVPCETSLYTAGQVISITNDLQVRYGPQHSSSGRFTIEEPAQVELIGPSHWEDGSCWWTVKRPNSTWTGWAPEDGAFALSENDPFNQSVPVVVVTPTAEATAPDLTCRLYGDALSGETYIEVGTHCLYIRVDTDLNASPIRVAAPGSRFRLVEGDSESLWDDDNREWFHIQIDDQTSGYMRGGVYSQKWVDGVQQIPVTPTAEVTFEETYPSASCLPALTVLLKIGDTGVVDTSIDYVTLRDVPRGTDQGFLYPGDTFVVTGGPVYRVSDAFGCAAWLEIDPDKAEFEGLYFIVESGNGGYFVHPEANQ